MIQYYGEDDILEERENSIEYRNNRDKYERAYKIVSDFLEGDVWRKYWRYPLFLLDKLRCKLVPYSKSDEKFLKEWSAFIGSPINITSLGEGYCVKKDDTIYILYQTDNLCPERKTYVFHHEGGHVIGLHPILYKDVLLSNDWQKDRLEEEATVIGRNVFFPAYVLDYLLSFFDYNTVKKYYNEVYHVSKQYFETRVYYLERDLQNIIYPACIQVEAEVEKLNLERWLYSREYV